MFALCWVVECITHKHLWGGLTGLYHSRYTNYYHAFSLTVFSFLPNRNGPLSIFFLAVDPSYCWLYPSKQAVDFFMLFACLYHALFSHWNASLSKFWQWIPLHVLLALADYWLRQVWIISKVSLTPGSQPGYKLNCTHRVGGWGERLNKFHGQYRYLPGTHHCLTTQLTDLVWSD